MVQTGAADVVMAGGVESMSNVEYYTGLPDRLGGCRLRALAHGHRPGAGGC
jgi:acetyl-CoA acetyltransferase